MNDVQWEKLSVVIGTAGEEYTTLAGRKAREDELERLVAGWTGQRTPAEVEERLRKAGVPCHIVSRPRDVYEDPQLAARGYWQILEHPVMGPQKYEPQSSFILSKTPRRIVRQSPCLGEHNGYVFKDLLKMSDDEIAGYLADGSITTELPGEFKASM